MRSQDVARSDLGKPKPDAQARRLRRINSLIEVSAIVADVEDVPLGRLRADVLLGCVDSRRARQVLNQAATRLGIPWIDAGVNPDGLLARVSIYAPGPDAPCLECIWDDRDYDLIEQLYPCDGAALAAAPTNAPSSLGALAAAVQAIECQKLLGGLPGCADVGTEVVIDTAYRKQLVTTLRRNPGCRFDHQTWQVEAAVPAGLALAQAIQTAGGVGEDHPHLQIEGRTFFTRSACTRCGVTVPFVHLAMRAMTASRPAAGPCAGCGREMAADRTSLVEFLDVSALAEADRQRSLACIGLRPGDVFGVLGSSGARHFEVSIPGRHPVRARRWVDDEAGRER